MLGKASKALSVAITQAAGLEAANYQLQYQLDTIIDTRSRKQVAVNPNDRFSTVDSITVAIERSRPKPSRKATKPKPQRAIQVVEAAVTTCLESMCT